MPPSRRRALSVRLLLPVAAVLVLPLLPATPAEAAAPASAPLITTAAAQHATAAKAPDQFRATTRGRAAVRWATKRSHWPTRTCMVFVRSALGVGPRYATPRIAWAAASRKHYRTSFSKIPAGVPVYSAGRSAPGHIALSLGRGMVRTTDWPRPGRVGTVRLSTLLRSWGHRYIGWSEDLNGVRVWRR